MDKPYKEILICAYSNDLLFDLLADSIISDLTGELINQLQNEDSRYHDFLIGREHITLHMNTFIGITIFPTELNLANDESEKITEIVGSRLKLVYKKHLSEIEKSKSKENQK